MACQKQVTWLQNMHIEAGAGVSKHLGRIQFALQLETLMVCGKNSALLLVGTAGPFRPKASAGSQGSGPKQKKGSKKGSKIDSANEKQGCSTISTAGPEASRHRANILEFLGRSWRG